MSFQNDKKLKKKHLVRYFVKNLSAVKRRVLKKLIVILKKLLKRIFFINLTTFLE